ncbi:SDR family NAD(P)-dependent oxidoreductase [Chitinophaga polysaccharea]|nr:SDR family NAD(P)-dependent oxidoreductase [Chitinophaga polysaccharea]
MTSIQQPIHSHFNANSTAAEIAAGHDLKGKTILVTGGNSGIGYETVKALASAGARVVATGRDAHKANDRLSALPNVSFMPLDLADPLSVDTFAEQFLAAYPDLHLLINNAGIFRPPQLQKDQRGYELQFGVNHLGHFQLTGRLWPALRNAGGARVVVLSSVGHRRSELELDDLQSKHHPYDSAKAYGLSKTANVLFTVELDRIGSPHGIRAFAVHPGAVHTDIFRYMTDDERQIWDLQIAHFKSQEQGAATTVWCALSDQLNDIGGVYCEDCNIAPIVPNDAPPGRGVRGFALDPRTAGELWQFSEAATGISWP